MYTISACILQVEVKVKTNKNYYIKSGSRDLGKKLKVQYLNISCFTHSNLEPSNYFA